MKTYTLDTPEDIERALEQLRNTVMPWPDNDHADYYTPTRKNGLGEILGGIDGTMGGYSNRLMGDGVYGYRAGGQGSALTGASGSVIRGNTPSLAEAKAFIDAFIRKVRPGMVWLENKEGV